MALTVPLPLTCVTGGLYSNSAPPVAVRAKTEVIAMFEIQLKVWPLYWLTLISAVPSPKVPLPFTSREARVPLLISIMVRSGRLVRQVVVFGVGEGVGLVLGEGVGVEP